MSVHVTQLREPFLAHRASVGLVFKVHINVVFEVAAYLNESTAASPCALVDSERPYLLDVIYFEHGKEIPRYVLHHFVDVVR